MPCSMKMSIVHIPGLVSSDVLFPNLQQSTLVSLESLNGVMIRIHTEEGIRLTRLGTLLPPLNRISPRFCMNLCFQTYICNGYCCVKNAIRGLILGLCPANDRRHYFAMTCLIGWVQAKNQHCFHIWKPCDTAINNQYFDLSIYWHWYYYIFLPLTSFNFHFLVILLFDALSFSE